MQGDSGSPLVGRVHAEGEEDDRAVLVGVLSRGEHYCNVSAKLQESPSVPGSVFPAGSDSLAAISAATPCEKSQILRISDPLLRILL